jgi:subtilisin family serine protease
VRKLGSITLAACLASSLLVPAAAAAAPEDPGATDRYQPTLTPPPVDASEFDYGTGDAPREYFVRLAGEPAAMYRGGLAGIPATTQMAEDGTYEFQAESAAAEVYRERLVDEQASVLDEATAAVGRELEVTGSFTVANHGFTATMTPDEARALGELDDVTWLQQVPDYELHTDAGPDWVNAGGGAVWERPADGGIATGEFLGEGIVVGIIDTGINPSNPSFLDESADGYTHTNPRGEGEYVGSCDPTNVPGGDGEGVVLEAFGQTQPFGSHYDADLAELCNDKLIGMWGYAGINGGSPIDYNGHGSHTAGTAAGNFVDGAVVDTAADLGDANDFDLSGVAPRANIISYAACCTGGGLYSAVDQLVVDGVDVVNYSIGSASPTANLLQDPMTYGFLVARANGVHVANSAGNSGPGNETIGSPSDAPWLTVVGSSTHDRLAGNVVGDFDGGDGDLADIQGKGVSEALDEPTELLYAGDFDNPLCLPDVWGDDVFDGEIVVCDRGETGRVDKSVRAADAGAGGFVLANDEPNAGSIAGTLNGDSFPIPGVHITYADGVALKAWMDEADAPTATIAGTEFVRSDEFGDIVSVFSSRGPNTNDASVLSPDVTAPGHDILAAYGADDVTEYQFISGTSMSSPHVAGAYAILAEAFGPDVSPAAAQSALQLTARRDVTKSDGTTPADPYDVGSGHIDVAAALATGLVLDEDAEGYIGAITSGDTAGMNVASLAQMQCAAECSWTRTVTAPASLDGALTWTATTETAGFEATVEPGEFTLAPGESQELTVTADVTELEVGDDAFGSLELTNGTEAISDAHLPMAVRPSLFAGATALQLESDGYQDTHTEPFNIAGASDLQLTVDGLAAGTRHDFEVEQDPTEGDPFTDLDASEVTWIDAPVNTKRITARVLETTAPDIDIFLGYDANGDGVPQPDELIAAGTSPGSDETVDVVDEALPSGRYWVITQAWEASEDGSDPVSLVTAAMAAGAAGNLEADVTGDVTEGGNVDLELAWSLAPPSTYWIGLVTMGTSAGSPEDIGSILLDIAVQPAAPDADAGGPYEVTLGEELTLDGSGSSHPEGEELEFVWDVTALGGDAPLTGVTPTIEPEFIGEFEVELEVTAAGGATDTDTATVVVADVPPAPTCDPEGPSGFPDLTGGPHAGNVGCAAGFGIIQGRTDGSFDPSGDVRRDQMAAFLQRTLRVGGVELPEVSGSGWPDVVGGPHEEAIGQLTEVGIVQGRSGGDVFDPSGTVTRAQMASFLRRTLEFATGDELDAPRSPFTDIQGSVHASSIDVVYDLEIAFGRTATTYEPSGDVRRDQMGSFLARTLDVMEDVGLTLTPLP